jgi:hypothetical protein
MKNNNSIFHQIALLLFILISGCSPTYLVTSNTSEEKHNTITKEAFNERVCGKNVTITFKSNRFTIGTILSVIDGFIFLLRNHDTLAIPMQETRFVSVKHELLGAIIGLPLGILTGGLIGFGVGQTSSSESRHEEVGEEISGLVVGSIIGATTGTVIGIVVCPTTTYELWSTNDIFEKQHVP